MRSPRIFIGFENVAGYASMLQKGFHKHGVQCDLFTRSIHKFAYQTVNQNPMVLLFQRVFQLYKKLYQSESKVVKSCGYLIDIFAITPFFIHAIFKYDVFIFPYKACFYQFLGFMDLPILKLFKKKLIFIFHGTDARPPYINGAFLSKRGIIGTTGLNLDNGKLKILHKRTQKWKNDIRTIERYADVIINNPPTSHFHEKPVVSFLRIGIPYEDKNVSSTKRNLHPEETIILHSPSNPAAKGTETIRQAIQSLKDKGHAINYIELINQPNSVVLENLAHCDFIVDQVYTTNPMPGFVTEAAAFGKPAVICGYFHHLIHKILPPHKIPPSHYLHPDEIEAAIERLIVDKAYRTGLGQQAKAFLIKHWRYDKVAQRYLRLIGDDIPDKWRYNPYDITYIHGGCLSEKNARAVIKALVRVYGKQALYLSDKPELEKQFLAFMDAA